MFYFKLEWLISFCRIVDRLLQVRKLGKQNVSVCGPFNFRMCIKESAMELQVL